MSAIEELRATVARLRGPGGCPWDREQTHQSLTTCLVEECSELLDTIDRLDFDHMVEELGDVLLQVVFHAQMADEAGRFDLERVAAEVNDKLVRRHPHVFGDEADLPDAEAVLHRWEEIKAEEKAAGVVGRGGLGQKNGAARARLFKDLPPRLPALLFAYDVVKQIEKKNLPDAGQIDHRAIDALAGDLDEASAGQRLFEIAAACRRAQIDPEAALRRHAAAVVEKVEEGPGEGAK